MTSSSAPFCRPRLRVFGTRLLGCLPWLWLGWIDQTYASSDAFVALQVNGEALDRIVLVRVDADGRVSMTPEDLSELRLQVPSQDSREWVLLDELAGLRYDIDVGTQTLRIDAPAQLYAMTRIRAEADAATAPELPPHGAFINYDFVASDVDGVAVDGFLELAWFGPHGVVTSTHLLRNLDDHPNGLRLDTTWSRDDPQRGTTVRLGDSFTSRTAWSPGLRFAGVQWASNPDTQPERPRLPLQSFVGETELPSTLEVYVNDALRLRTDLPPGPFAIEDLPVITGAGLTRVVVRDILGREQILTQPFYGSNNLLRKGLRDFSVEVGVLRQAYGQQSNRYGQAIASATWRQGLSDLTTAEAQAQFSSNLALVGIGIARALGGAGVGEFNLAASRSSAERGQLLDLAYRYQGRQFSLGGRWQWRSSGFLTHGLSLDTRRLRQQGQIFGSIAQGPRGSFGISYTSQLFDDQSDLAIIGLTHTRNLGRWGFLSLSLLQINGDESEKLATLNYSLPLARATSLSASLNHRSEDDSASMQLQRSLPAGRGLGYRLRADTGGTGRVTGNMTVRTDLATASLDLARSQGQWSTRVALEGGLVWFADRARLSRTIDDSFAVVDVGLPNIRVSLDNQPVGATNSGGKIMVPGLRAYERNRIAIEQADLPLSAQFERLSQQVVPYARSGTLVEFDVRTPLSVLLSVHLPSGEPVPAGSRATLIATGERFPVGYDGEVYLSGVAATNELLVEGAGWRCLVRFEHPGPAFTLPTLGPLTCRDLSERGD